jgi:Glycosyl transferase family 2
VGLVTITMTRNDVDVLEPFVRHHVEIADAMVIILHRCADNSEEVLRALIAEGLPIELRFDETPDGETLDTVRLTPAFSVHTSTMALTHTMREIAERDRPDWILPVDSDEFLRVDDGRLADVFAHRLAPENAAGVMWQTFVPVKTDPADEPNVVRRITHRRVAEGSLLPKVMVPLHLALREDLVLSNGHHVLFHLKDGAIVPSTVLDSLKLAHYPVRSDAQLRAKIASGWLSAAASPTLAPGEAWHWKVLFDRLRDPAPLSADELTAIGSSYSTEDGGSPLVHDPLPTGDYALRVPARPVAPWTLLADVAEQLAVRLSRCAARNDAARMRLIEEG